MWKSGPFEKPAQHRLSQLETQHRRRVFDAALLELVRSAIMTGMDISTAATDINVLAAFLSDAGLSDLSSTSRSVDCIVICASAVIYQAESLFTAIENRPSLAKCLVLCGGVGHSTQLLYDSIGIHPRYSQISQEVEGLPEARVLELILERFFNRRAIEAQGCRILIEDQSTNCGLNASFTRKVLDKEGFHDISSCIIIQDPTMMRRTRASFEKTYENWPFDVDFTSCPIFVPKVEESSTGVLTYCSTVDSSGLWSMPRFLELILGEIPRLRDDENGYGPNGRSFIPHVDIPVPVERAWSNLAKNNADWRKL